MEKELNIAAILKDKPKNTKLWSCIYGNVYLDGVNDFEGIKLGHHGVKAFLLSSGKAFEDGEVCLSPSKKMRDWEKFAWKRGDVLVNSRGLKILFDRWANDNYTSFYAKTINLVEDGFLDTNLHTLASEKEAKSFIKCIEEKLGGKLNRETLKIEKAQPEFKDGDIIKMTWDKYSAIVIFWEYSNFGKGLNSHVFFNIKTKIIEYNIHGHTLQDMILRLATEEEKQQLFDALATEGKAWDAEKKQIVDLKQKCEFKPFDRCIWKIRNCEGSIWQASFVSYVDKYGATPMGISIDEDLVNLIILPYNDQTKLLV